MAMAAATNLGHHHIDPGWARVGLPRRRRENKLGLTEEQAATAAAFPKDRAGIKAKKKYLKALAR